MNRYFWLAVASVLVFAACLVAVLLLLSANASEENAINLALQAIGALAGLGSCVFTLIGRNAQNGSTGDQGPGISLGNAPVIRVATGERDQAASFKAYIRQLERQLINFGLNSSSFVPLTMVKGPNISKAVAPDFLPDLELLSRRADSQFVQAEPEKITLVDIPDRFDQSVLLGEPGSGKTTCLQHLALEVLAKASAWLATEEKAPFGLAGDYPQLPLYASLSQWSQGIRAIEFLRNQLQNLLGPENYYVTHFESLLADGCFILLLDGLNELPGRRPSPSEGRHDQREEPGRTSRKPEMAAASIDRREIELRELASSIGLQSKFILTCRSHEYFDSRRWQTIRILPMNRDQIGNFIDSYLESESAANLKSSLDSDNRIATIANNPFFLRVIISIYRPGLKLTNRGQILAYLYKTLLQRERERGTVMPRESILTSHIGKVSYEMLAARKIGNNAAIEEHDDTRRAHLRILAGTGLVVERDGSFFFFHQIIQEFFAAMALNARAVRRNTKALLADKRWSEVVALWCDVDNDHIPDKVVAALRARNLPLRRPRSTVPPLLSIYRLLLQVTIIVVMANYFWNWVLGAPHLLTFPIHGLGLAPLALAVAAMAIGQIWLYSIRHHKITVNAAYVLSQIGYLQALPDIISSLSWLYYAESAEVADNVARSFGTAALEQAAHGLEHRRWRVRLGCVLIMGEIASSYPDDRHAVEYLLAVAGAGDPQLMRALVEALGRCRDTRAPQALGQLLSRSPMNGFNMAHRLAPLAKWGSGSDIAWNEDSVARFDDLAKKYRSPFIRGAAFQAIGVLRIPDCEARLSAIAVNLYENKVVRQSAIKGLGLAQTPLAVECLAQIAEQRGDMRKLACTTLQQIRDPAAIPSLATAATSSRWEVRQAAAAALGATGRAETFHALELLANDDDYDVRECAARALSLLDLPAAVPVLGRLARDGVKQVRRAALEALNSRYPQIANRELMTLAEDRSYPERLKVIRSLGRYAHPDTEETLNSLLASPDKDVRDVASQALRELQEAAGKKKSPAGKTGSLSRGIRRLGTWLQFDGYMQLMKEERMTGIPESMVMSSVNTRILTDAELTRRFQPLIRLYFILFAIFIVFALFTVALLFRFSLWAAVGMLDEWPYFVGLLAFVTVISLPVINGLMEIALFRSLRQVAYAVLLIGLFAGAFYVWWIIAPGLVVATLLIIAISARRRKRRRRDVRAALRLPRAALTSAT